MTTKREKMIVKKLISMKQYGDEGWKFTVCNQNYRTDRNGEGLWHGDTQCIGTMQFSLPTNRNAAYKKIARYFKTEIDFWKLLD
jgi:hypothetical protein